MSFSASDFILCCDSGVNSPEASLSCHFWQARPKNSLLSPVPLSLVLPSPHWTRSTSGSNCSSLCWYSGGNPLKVCLLRIARRLALTRIEDGFCRSTQPSRVLWNWAAADRFRVVLLLVFRWNPGMEAKTSRIVVCAGCCCCTGGCSILVSSSGVSSLGTAGSTLTVTRGIKGIKGSTLAWFDWLEAMLVFLRLLFACCFRASWSVGRFTVLEPLLNKSGTMVSIA